MSETKDRARLPGGRPSSVVRTLAAVLIGLASSLFIWVAAPLNNFLLGNSYIADDYLPVAALFVVFVLVLGVNPLLRRLAPSVALETPQLALVFAMVLVACITPSTGLLRALPYSISQSCIRVSTEKKVAEGYEAVNPPRSLFPDELGYQKEMPNAEKFLDQLKPEEPIPWFAWIPPLLSWGGFVLPWMVAMVALAVIVLPQWRENERLPFPLVTIGQTLIESPGEGRLVPPIFRSRPFWLASGAVFLLHLMNGLNSYFPDRVPSIPTAFDLSGCFTGEYLQYVNWSVKWPRIHFIYLGVAFFMPGRVGFSIWFFQVAYCVIGVLGNTLAPPFNTWQVHTDHSTGAFIVLPLFTIWLGRKHFLRVLRCMVSGTGSAADWRDRLAGYAFLLGCAGMFSWLVWVNVLPLWALWLVVMAVLFSIAITRTVAETGLPLLSADPWFLLTPVRMIPIAWRTAASMYFAGFMSLIVSYFNRVCAMTMALHGLAADRDSSPRRHLGMGGLFILLIIASVIIAGSVHLWISYRHDAQLNGGQISAWGRRNFAVGPENTMYMWQTQHKVEPQRYWGVGFGMALALSLQLLCLMSPTWPLHPVALLFVFQWYAATVWFSVFLGWFSKTLIIRYGGAKLYASARPFFIGLILGDVFAVFFWVAVSAALGALGLKYNPVTVLPF